MILVAGIGNIFLGDDGFGSETVRRMAAGPLADHVRLVDFGIRGIDLIYSLLDGYDAVFIIDAVSRGEAPGTIYVIEPDLSGPGENLSPIEAHSMDPMRVLALAQSMGAPLRNIRIVGCEPESFGPPNEGRMSLSPVVSAAIDTAIEVTETLIQEALV